ncbi:DoxX family membrane protein [Halorhabdus sp. CBA1104]|uniref:DoxX family membrane protein n=1 Tax=unclassified Halorhabdus TaxID=2621901 RepID=UPI0012B40D1E|nr:MULTISPECIES: DoxX family membrane protein [unclassified Halorhabdus]QGN06342.1 DoxX family membrane protein [Halorhabdus sp. CBA1104]
MANTEVDTTLFGTDVSYEIDGRWLAYFTFLLRAVVGYWFFHAGITKIIDGFSAEGYLKFAADYTIMEPIVSPFASGIGLEFANFMIPVGETLIGLGVLVGLLVRLASFFGVFLMLFFVTINNGWGHSIVTSDLMGLLLFVAMIVLGAGRVWGLDAYVEKMAFVQNNPWLRYLLG